MNELQHIDNLSGYEDSKRPEQIKRASKIPKEKKDIVASYLSIKKQKYTLLKKGMAIPQGLTDEIKCYDRVICLQFKPQERTLIQARVAIIKNGMKS